MNKKTGAIIIFGIILFFLIFFGVEFFEGIWSFPSFSLVPFIIVALLGYGNLYNDLSWISSNPVFKARN